jgi:predicted HAD superfamily phosphohydrolase YqeG
MMLARHLKPTVHLESVTLIDSAFLSAHKVSALLWDVDGTLMPNGATVVGSSVRALLHALHGDVAQAILSNCDDARLMQLAAMFTELPVLKAYALKGGLVLRRLQSGKDEWSIPHGEEWRVVERPTGPMRAIRKPSADLIALAVHMLGASREAVFMIGDQYFTDIAGANLAGIRSVKVDTVAPTSFPFAIRTLQRVERFAYRTLYGRGSASWGGPRQ